MIGVAIMGGGVVGGGVAEMLVRNRELLSRAARDDVRALYMLDVREVSTPEGVALTHRFEDILEDERVRVVAETIGGAGVAYEFTRKCLAAGRHVVTSNKELVAEKGDELIALAHENNVSYLYEASVGGGIPVLRPIQQDLRGNRLTAIDGIVNGSTNYLLTRMRDAGMSFPAALGEAKRLGYVEADPAADVEGLDARRKLAILANAAFGARLEDNRLIPTVGISAITEGDMRAAAAFSGAVKLIAHAALSEDEKGWSGWVHPCFVPQGHPLYPVSDVFNGVLIHGDFVDDVMFFGRGAGSHPTASAVVGDILEAAQSLNAPRPRLRFDQPPVFQAPGRESARLLVRFPAVEEDAWRAAFPGCEVKPCGEGEGALLTAPAPLEALEAARLGFKNGGAPLYALS